MNDCPKYLKEYSEIWKTDHKKAKLEWFKNAKYGMFIHYGLYSMLHQQEWVLFYQNIQPVTTKDFACGIPKLNRSTV